MTIRAAALEAITNRWLVVHEVREYVYRRTGHFCETTAISARLRDLRKVQYGSHPVQCRFVDGVQGKKVYQYSVGG